MAANGERSRDAYPPEIRLILEEIRDLKKDNSETGRRIDRSLKEAAEDRKQAAEDRKEFNKNILGMRDALVVIGNVGRRIIKTQEAHTKLLSEIRDALRARGGNGRHGNGREGSGR